MKTYQSWLFTVGFAVYVGTLGVLTADNIFQLGLFPPKLDRILMADIAKLASQDEKEAKAAQEEIVSYHEFSVPPLLRAMERGDAAHQARCAECLRLIASRYFLSDANYGTDSAAWRRWWSVIQAMDGLHDERPSARKKAQEQIAEHGRFAIPILIDALRDPNRTFCVLVADTLAQIAATVDNTKPHFGPDREKWLAWWKTQQPR